MTQLHVLKKFCKICRTIPVPEAQAWKFIKKRLCDFYETFKNIFFTDQFRATASALRNRLLKNLKYMEASPVTEQKIKFSIKDFFSKCDQIRKKLRIWSHLLKKCFMENFIFCAVSYLSSQDVNTDMNIQKS